MAQTVVSNTSALSPTQIQEKVAFLYASRKNFFARLVGTAPDSIIRLVNDLQSKSGSIVKVPIFGKSSDSGVDGDSTLEGNEEALTPYTQTLYLQQKRKASRTAGEMTDKNSAVDLQNACISNNAVWAKDWVSELLAVYMSGRRGTRTMTVLPTSFTGFGSNSLTTPDATHTLWAGAAGTEAAMVATDILTTKLLDKAYRQISLLINSGVPMQAPFMGGRFPLFVSPEAWYDLSNDPMYIARSESVDAAIARMGPKAEGAVGIWKNFVIFQIPEGVKFTTSASVTAYQALVLGVNAAAWVQGKSGSATELSNGAWGSVTKDFDYGNQVGYSINCMMGFQKMIFNSMDNAIFSIMTGASS